MKMRSLTGNFAIGVFVICLVTIVVSFCAPTWLVSDYRITGAKFDKLGLWSHCFRSLADNGDDTWRRFFVGCRWVYDPFTTGYDKIRGYLLPPFMIATQFFYTLTFIAILVCAILVLLYFLCCGPDQAQYILLIYGIALLLMIAGSCGGLAVIIFATSGNTDGWMPGHVNNYFGWGFGLAVVGVVAAFVSGALFLVEANVQDRKRNLLKESQTRFELESETKA